MLVNQRLKPLLTSPGGVLFSILGLSTLLSLGLALVWDAYYLALLPVLLLVLYWAVVDFHKVFLLLLFSLPLSTEVVFDNGFGTDLPSEPLILGCLLGGILILLRYWPTLSKHFLLHPVSLLVLVHFFWIVFTTLASGDPFISLKFTLAKAWYLGVFYFLAGYFIWSVRDYNQAFWSVFWPLLATVLIVLIRHSTFGFSFREVNFVLFPFYRNHVAYAGILALFFPLLWFAWRGYPTGSVYWWGLLGTLVLFLVAIYFSYTRAAYLAIVFAGAGYVVVRLRLMRPLLASIAVLALAGSVFLTTGNRYLAFAPDYNKTISHESFDNLIQATYKLEDISTMERVYRWVAAAQMVPEHPWLGFGPGTFTRFYRFYTVNSFRTYVSENKEQSGVHCYYLMTLVEQGIIGLVIFLALSFLVLAKGEQAYHQCVDPQRRRIILAVLLCTIAIDTLLIINDMIETDKVGSFFFLCMAVIVNQDLQNKAQMKAEAVAGPAV